MEKWIRHLMLLFSLLASSHLLAPSVAEKQTIEPCGKHCARSGDMARCLRVACRRLAMKSVIRFGKRGEFDREYVAPMGGLIRFGKRGPSREDLQAMGGIIRFGKRSRNRADRQFGSVGDFWRFDKLGPSWEDLQERLETNSRTVRQGVGSNSRFWRFRKRGRGGQNLNAMGGVIRFGKRGIDGESYPSGGDSLQAGQHTPQMGEDSSHRGVLLPSSTRDSQDELKSLLRIMPRLGYPMERIPHVLETFARSHGLDNLKTTSSGFEPKPPVAHSTEAAGWPAPATFDSIPAPGSADLPKNSLSENVRTPAARPSHNQGHSGFDGLPLIRWSAPNPEGKTTERILDEQKSPLLQLLNTETERMDGTKSTSAVHALQGEEGSSSLLSHQGSSSSSHDLTRGVDSDRRREELMRLLIRFG